MEKAKKFDGDKPRTDLVPVEAILGMAKVFGFGAKKYGDMNWAVDGGLEYSRLYGAVLRHVFAWYSGEDTDPESGLPHLHHAMCGLAMLADSKTNKDDRPI